MKSEICNGIIVDEERSGWLIACPNCNYNIKYTVLNIESGLDIFLYNESNSDFLLRKEDRQLAREILEYDETALIKEIETIYTNIENSNISLPDGGRFKINSNIKCPDCSYEFPLKNKSKTSRFLSTKLVWIEGAIAYRGKEIPSNRLLNVNIE